MNIHKKIDVALIEVKNMGESIGCPTKINKCIS